MNEADIWAHLDALAKPPRSLGMLETLAVRLATIQQRLDPQTRPRRIVLFAADHGVTAHTVSAWPATVTGLMVATIASGRASSNALAAAHGCDLRLVDVGVAHPVVIPASSAFRSVPVASGTADLSAGPAMTIAQFNSAWNIGASEAARAVDEGFRVLITGEMGIGNTTAAACLTALLTGLPAASSVGPGAGADGTILAAKQAIVEAAVARVQPVLAADIRSAIAAVAGFEIVAMAGFMAEAAARNVTILLDGYVATAGALIAERLAPGSAAMTIAAHQSAEPGHAAALGALGLAPLLDWKMRLGEGSGALVALPMLDSAAALLGNVALLRELGAGNAA
jgi:nicotinate-nucleotide--dimethylbenzimidazole phosphoribosyltransferase